MLKILLGLKCIVFLGFTLHAAIPIVKHYDHLTYKAGGENWDACQDDQGVMYFANEKGILRFNGEVWSLLFNKEYTTVRSLAKSKKNIIYIGSDNDLGYITIGANSVAQYVSLRDKLDNRFAYLGEVWKVIYKDGTVFFQTPDRIYLYDENEEAFVKEIEATVFVRGLYSVNEDIYLVDQEKGLLKYQSGEFIPVDGGSFLRKRQVNCLLPFSDGRLLAYTFKQGLLIYENGKFTPWEVPFAEEIRSNYVFCGLKYNNDFLIGTVLNGVYLIDESGQLKNVYNTENGLVENKVFNLYQGKDGNTWICFELGIANLNMDLPFRMVNSSLGIQGSVRYVNVIGDSIFFCSSKGIFAGKAPTSIKTIDKNSKYNNYRGIIGPCNFIKKVYGLLVYGHLDGLKQIKRNKIEIVSKTSNCTGLFEIPGSEELAFVCFDKGLELMKVSGDSIYTVQLFNNLRGIEEIVFDEEGVVWMSGKYNGVYKLKFNSDFTKIVDEQLFFEESGLPSDYKNIVFKFGGKIHMGTLKGVYTFDGEFFRHDERFSEIGQESVSVVFVKGGNLWIQAGESSMGFDKKPVEFYVYNDELKQIPEFTALKNFKGEEFANVNYISDSLYIFSGSKTTYFFFPGDFSEQSQAGQIHFESVFVHNRDNTNHLFMSSDYDFFLDEEKLFTKGEISYEYNSVSFEVYSSSYQNPEKNEYRFFLEGFDKAWTPWTHRNTRRFENLPAGNYKLLVESKNVFGAPSDTKEFEFTILAPWYKSWWFYLLEMVILASLVYASFYSGKSEKISKYTIFLVILTGLSVLHIMKGVLESILESIGVGDSTIRFIQNILLAAILAIVAYWFRGYYAKKFSKNK